MFIYTTNCGIKYIFCYQPVFLLPFFPFSMVQLFLGIGADKLIGRFWFLGWLSATWQCA